MVCTLDDADDRGPVRGGVTGKKVERAAGSAEAPVGDRGGVGVMDVDNNLTYMDILITPKTKGGGKGSGGSGSGRG